MDAEMNLKSIGLENFRVFSEKMWFDFKPITILTGTNNSGKSSLVKGINLLGAFLEKRTTENPDILDIPKLMDSLGDFAKLPNNKTKHDIISFYLPFHLRGVINKMQLKLEFKQVEGKVTKGKLIGLSILLSENEEVIFSCIETKELSFNIKINYFFFLEQYKSESEMQNQMDEIIGQYVNERDGLIDSPELQDELFLKYFFPEENVHFREYYFKRDKFFKQEADKTDIQKQFFDWHEEKRYSSKESLFVFSNEHIRYDGKEKSGVDYFGISPKEYLGIEKEFLEKYEFNVSFHDANELKDVFEILVSSDNKLEPKKWKQFQQKGIEKRCADISDPIINYFDWEKFENFISKDGLKHIIVKGENGFIGGCKNKRIVAFQNELDQGYFGITEFELDNYQNNKIVEYIKDGGNLRIPRKENIGANEDATNEKSLSMSEFFFKYFVYNNIQCCLHEVLHQPLKNFNFISTFKSPVQRIYNKESHQFNGIIEKIMLARDNDNYKVHFDFIDKYLQLFFGVGTTLEIEAQAEGLGNRVYLITDSEKVLLADMGYGVSQILPLILQIALTGIDVKKATEDVFPKIYTEEPETNLHPALQSKLADMFVEANELFKIQFLIETHSEYLIRKFQYLTASNKSQLKPEGTALYYFYHPDRVPSGEPQVKKINILEDGSLSDDFGRGFFDEADNIAMDIFLMNQSQKN